MSFIILFLHYRTASILKSTNTFYVTKETKTQINKLRHASFLSHQLKDASRCWSCLNTAVFPQLNRSNTGPAHSKYRAAWVWTQESLTPAPSPPVQSHFPLCTQHCVSHSFKDKTRDSWINSSRHGHTPATLLYQDAACPKGPLPFLKTLAPHQ